MLFLQVCCKYVCSSPHVPDAWGSQKRALHSLDLELLIVWTTMLVLELNSGHLLSHNLTISMALSFILDQLKAIATLIPIFFQMINFYLKISLQSWYAWREITNLLWINFKTRCKFIKRNSSCLVILWIMGCNIR